MRNTFLQGCSTESPRSEANSSTPGSGCTAGEKATAATPLVSTAAAGVVLRKGWRGRAAMVLRGYDSMLRGGEMASTCFRKVATLKDKAVLGVVNNNRVQSC